MHLEPPKHHQPESLRELFALLLKPIKELFEEPLPRGVNFFQTTGSMCAFIAVLQMTTGVLMAFYYTPSVDVAWESVQYVDTRVRFGAMIHALHHWGSSAFVVLVLIHIIRVFVFAGYKGRRRWTWLVGVGILATVLGFGFTGYLLPWDMKAYFGTQVGTNIAGEVPVIGASIRRFLLGGSEISELTLPRFYALHVFILPAALIGLVGLHLGLVRLYGITPPWKRDDEPVEYAFRFFPTQAARDSLMIALVFGSLMFVAWKFGGNLGAKADPDSTTFAPHPEWYFLGAQQLLRYFEGVWGTFVIPACAFLLIVILPFIDRNPERRISKRPIALGLGAASCLALLALTVQGYRELEHERKVMAEETELEMDDVEVTQAMDDEPEPTDEGQDFQFTDRDARQGETLYAELRCADCHEDEDAGMGLNIPPTLKFTGDQFRAEWMMAYLKDVPRRRYEKRNRFPKLRMPNYGFSDSELRRMTAYMMSLHDPELFGASPMVFNASTPEKVELGEELYESESCSSCHHMSGKGVKNAPDLTNVGSRLLPAFIFHIVKQTQAIVPESLMEDSLLDDEEIEALTYYMMTLKSE